MDDFTQLEAWKNGLEIVKEIYVLSKKFPTEEMFGLTSQIRRSSTSILANLAEGFGKFTFPDKAAKYAIARGECLETEAHIRIAVALNFVTDDEAKGIIERLRFERKLLNGLIASSKIQRY
jgi:four helix bundle protein